jgi:V/A-type H+/Na+-transporting ATPase subunit I
MIVEMKKITLFVSSVDRRNALKHMRGLGAVHLKDIQHKSSEEINALEPDIEQTKQAVGILKQYKVKTNKPAAYPDHIQASVKVKEIVELNLELQQRRQELEHASKDLEWFGPWGGFNPNDINALAEQGIYIRLYRLTTAEYKQISDRADIEIINRNKHYCYLAHITRDKKNRLPFQAVSLLTKDYKALCAKNQECQKRIGEITADLIAETGALLYLEGHLKALEKKYQFVQAVNNMKEGKGFAYLQGYIPADSSKALKQFAESFDMGYILEKPDNPDDVPTLIRNPKWIETISPVFKFMNTVPGYAEYDISVWFLLFFSVFFAMLIGDAGYGLIFLAATFFIRQKLKNAPAQPFFLMYVLSATTIIWGAVTGTWFGAKAIAELWFLNPLIVRSISSFAEDNQNLMIFICFTIGIVHLTIAHIIVGLRILNSLKALSELGWILVLWALYFIAGLLVIGRPMPGYTLYLLFAGTVLLLCFSEPQRNIFKSIGSALTNIPLKIISSFADIVSYLRLFAVGYATVVLASTFNTMAMDIGFNSFISSILLAFILVFGHALNIVLGFMAVIVHGIRLNMLEFSGHMGMSWSGKEYAPFKE